MRGVMNKIAAYLQSHLSGEVIDNQSVRKHFSTDASVLELMPSLVIYPRTTNDIRKMVRFSWQLAEKGHVLSVTARGGGTDVSGAAIGEGVVMVFPAHLNKILELDTNQKLVRVQPGVNFKSLQETLYTHGLFLPPCPASYEYSTIGGAIANNTAGAQSLKYGPMSNWVEKLEVVLANGELIQTGRLSKKEVEKKKGLTSLEGELYRTVDAVYSEYGDSIEAYYDALRVSRDTVGYNLRNIRRRDGSIDLTSLFVGSQGTLGIITEIILKLAPHKPLTSLFVVAFDTADQALDAIDSLRDLNPTSLEMIDRGLIDLAIDEQHVVFPPEFVTDNYRPAYLIFAEFDDDKSKRSKKIKRAKRQLENLSDRIVIAEEPEEQEKMYALRQVSFAVMNYGHAGKQALPIIEDAVVSYEKTPQLIEAIRIVCEKNHIEPASWGHIGEANIRVYPLLDISKLGDRQKALRLMSEYYKLVVDLGGSIAATHGDGRIRAPFVRLQLGDDMFNVMSKLKEGIDPRGILNPGVKTGTDVKQLVDMLRKEYSLASYSNNLPWS